MKKLEPRAFDRKARKAFRKARKARKAFRKARKAKMMVLSANFALPMRSLRFKISALSARIFREWARAPRRQSPGAGLILYNSISHVQQRGLKGSWDCFEAEQAGSCAHPSWANSVAG